MAVLPDIETAEKKETIGLPELDDKYQELGVGPEYDHPHIKEALRNIGVGFADPIVSLSNLVNRGILSVPGAKKLISPKYQKEFLGQIDLPKEPGTAAAVERGIGQIPYFIGTGPEELAAKAPAVARTAAEYLSPLAKSLTARAAGIGALEDPDRPATGALTGIGGVLAGTALTGLPAATKALVQKGLRKGYSSEMYPYFKDRINTILNDIRGSSSPETSNRDVFDNIARHYDELEGNPYDLQGNEITAETHQYTHPQNSISAAYDKARDMSKGLDYNFDKGELSKSVTKELNDVNKSLDQYKEAPLFAKDKEDAANYLKNIQNVRVNSFEDADQLKRDLNNLIRERDINPQFRQSLRSVKQGLLDSTKKTYQTDPELYDIWRDADTRYAKELGAFRETARGKKSPFMKMHEKGGENVDKFVSKYIKPDSPDLLDNFMKIMPDDETRKMAAYDYLKRQGGKDAIDNPEVFLNKLKGLGPGQRKTLLPEHSEELEDMLRLQKKVPRAFKMPKEEAGIVTRALHKTPALAIGAATYGATGDIPATLASLAIPGATRAGVRSLLQTKSGRDFFMKQLAPSLLSRYRTPTQIAGALAALSKSGGNR